MRFLLVNRFFGVEQSPTGRMLWDVGMVLAKQGHQVTVLSSRGAYARPFEGQESCENAFQIIQVANVGQGRLPNWAWFWLRAMIRIPTSQWDRCLILTDPPFMLVAAQLTRFFTHKSRKVYWWTMDLYPEALEASGILGGSHLGIRLLRYMNEIGLSAVSGVIVLGPHQLVRLKRYKHWRSDENFAIVEPPWDHRPIDRVLSSKNRVIKRLGSAGQRVALYAGNLGEGHSFQEILEAARWFHEQGRTDWLFVFVVRGSGKALLEARGASLPNVRVMDYLPESETADLLWTATVHLITMKPGWEGVIVPSKLYGALQTAAPVLFIGPCVADTVQELYRLNRGIALSPESSGLTVAQALDELAQTSWLSQPYADRSGPARIAEYLTN
jgi:colanic acid biosynthesis glycosyl transferase WcaI